MPTLISALASVLAVRVVSGKPPPIPAGQYVSVVVTKVVGGNAVLDMSGESVVVRPGTGLQPGTVLLARAPERPSATVELELVPSAAVKPNQAMTPAAAKHTPAALVLDAAGRPVPANVSALDANGRPIPLHVPVGSPLGGAIQRTAPHASPIRQPVDGRTAVPASPIEPSPASTPPRLALIDVVSVRPDGRLSVQLDGREEVVTASGEFAPGSRRVVQVERTPGGLAIRSPTDSPDLAKMVAATILRAARPPDLAATLKPLLAELTPLLTANPPPAIRESAAAVSESLRQIIPDGNRPAGPAELRHLVEDGGLHFEAKLARLVENDGEPRGDSADKVERAIRNDLKGGLMRLLQAASELGTAATLPTARAAVDGIEAQQAANVLAQIQGTPFVLQVPFPDGQQWRTLHLAVEPESHGVGRDADQASGFRFLMHVPLTELGETWIDAGLTGDRFRAILYLERAPVRDRVRAELPSLQQELRAGGFAEVLLDVRAAADLPDHQRRQAQAMSVGRPGASSILDVRA
jgi:hypothetical protein